MIGNGVNKQRTIFNCNKISKHKLPTIMFEGDVCVLRLAKRLSPLEMVSVPRVQILDEAICVSLRANALRKGMNPFVSLQL